MDPDHRNKWFSGFNLELAEHFDNGIQRSRCISISGRLARPETVLRASHRFSLGIDVPDHLKNEFDGSHAQVDHTLISYRWHKAAGEWHSKGCRYSHCQDHEIPDLNYEPCRAGAAKHDPDRLSFYIICGSIRE